MRIQQNHQLPRPQNWTRFGALLLLLIGLTLWPIPATADEIENPPRESVCMDSTGHIQGADSSLPPGVTAARQRQISNTGVNPESDPRLRIVYPECQPQEATPDSGPANSPPDGADAPFVQPFLPALPAEALAEATPAQADGNIPVLVEAPPPAEAPFSPAPVPTPPTEPDTVTQPLWLLGPEVDSGSDPADLDQTGVITGLITGPDGGPLAGIRIAVFQYGTSSLRRSGMTDTSGHYVIQVPAPGEYGITFSQLDGFYLAEVYDDILFDFAPSTLMTGTKVIVADGQTVTNINAQLAAAGNIAGTITNASGQPIPNVSASLYRFNDQGVWEIIFSGIYPSTDSAGKYRVGGLPTDTYRLGFADNQGIYQQEYYDHAASVQAATDIAVTAGMTTTANATLGKAGMISGTVTAEGGAPLAGIRVTAYHNNGGGWQWAGSTSTNGGGAYAIGGLTTGTYRVGFSDSSGAYLPEFHENAATLDGGTDIPVTTDSVTTIDAVLQLAGRITGHVDASNGTALANIVVSAYHYVGSQWQYVANQSTNFQGDYTIGGLSTDTYRLNFQDYSGQYLAEYYNDAASLDSATDLSVTAGMTATANATLEKAGIISGTVTAEGGPPLSGIQVTAYRYNGNNWQSVGSRSTNAQGVYAIGGLTTDTYRVGFFDSSGNYLAEYHENATTVDAGIDIPVAADGVTTINAALQLAGRITGHVDASNGAALANIRVNGYHYVGGQWQSVASQSTNSQGDYTIGGLPTDNYRLHFQDYSGQYLAEYFNDANSLDSATDLSVTAGMTTTANATLEKAGIISGTVTAEGGPPLAGIQATAYRYNGNNWQWVGSRSTNAQGIYAIGGLTTDTYRVSFSDSSGDYLAEYHENATTLNAGTDIPVTTNNVTTINAALQLAGRITGTVTASNGNSLFDVRVRVYAQTNGSWSEVGSGVSASQTGLYNVGGLATGAYRVGFFPTRNYLSEYYDNASSLTDAMDVAVVAGTITSGINASLADGGKITGTVTGQSGAPLSNIWVTANRLVSYSWGTGWTTAASSQTDPSGRYALVGLPTDSYAVGFRDNSGQFVSEYHDNVLTISDAVTVPVVAGQTVADLDAVLSPAGHITGVVTGPDGAPLSGIPVNALRAQGASWSQVSYSTTDSAGRYDLDGLAGQTHRVYFSGNQNYLAEYYDDVRALADAADVPVTPGAVTPHINAELTLAGHITGTVTGADNQPLPGVSVTAYQANDGLWEWHSSNGTDTNGQYDVGRLAAGVYRIRYYDTNRLHLPEYYTDADELGAARNITVTVGATVPKIDAQLALGGHVTGTVTGADGTPLSGVSVSAYRVLNGNWSHESSDLTDATGAYDIGLLYTDAYRIRFSSSAHVDEYYNDVQDRAVGATVQVTAGQTMPDIDAVLDDGAAIQGTVTGTSDASERRLDGSAAEIGVNLYRHTGQGWTQQDWAYADAQGKYSFQHLPNGIYRVEFEDNGGIYASSLYTDGVDPYSEGALISISTAPTTTLETVMLLPGGQVSGTVSSEGGMAVENANVYLYRYNNWNDYWTWAGSAGTDANGRFHIGGLADGLYHMWVSHNSGDYVSEYHAGAQNIDDATHILIQNGDTQPDVNVRLAAAGHVSGTVKGPDGMPLQNVRAVAYSQSGQSWRSVGSSYTTMTGRYDIGGLSPGVYWIGFFDTTGAHATRYYDGAADLNSATSIQVAAGETAANIDGVLPVNTASPPSPGSLGGRVQASDNAGLLGIVVDLYRVEGNSWYWEDDLYTNYLGAYTFLYLAPGTYIVKYTDPAGAYAGAYYPGVVASSDIMTLPMEAGTSIPDVNVTLQPGAQLGGRITDPGGSGLPVIAASAYWYTGQYWSWVGSAYSGLDGLYQISGLPAGDITVRYIDPSGIYAQEVYTDAVSLSGGTPVAVSAGGSVSNIDASLSDGGAIAGTISNRKGDSLPTVYAGASIQDGDTWFWLDSDRADPFGNYVIRGLPAGVYRVSFWDSDGHYQDQFYNGTSSASAAQPVPVNRGQTTPHIDAVLWVDGEDLKLFLPAITR